MRENFIIDNFNHKINCNVRESLTMQTTLGLDARNITARNYLRLQHMVQKVPTCSLASWFIMSRLRSILFL